jgi:hypothetical protein
MNGTRTATAVSWIQPNPVGPPRRTGRVSTSTSAASPSGQIHSPATRYRDVQSFTRADCEPGAGRSQRRHRSSGQCAPAKPDAAPPEMAGCKEVSLQSEDDQLRNGTAQHRRIELALCLFLSWRVAEHEVNLPTFVAKSEIPQRIGTDSRPCRAGSVATLGSAAIAS